VKVFRFGVEAAAVQRAVNACGWQERVLQVDAIGQADLLIAVKDTAGGKHQNLTQVRFFSDADSLMSDLSTAHGLHVAAAPKLWKDVCAVGFLLGCNTQAPTAAACSHQSPHAVIRASLSLRDVWNT
jgi:hypothetical protein